MSRSAQLTTPVNHFSHPVLATKSGPPFTQSFTSQHKYMYYPGTPTNNNPGFGVGALANLAVREKVENRSGDILKLVNFITNRKLIMKRVFYAYNIHVQVCTSNNLIELHTNRYSLQRNILQKLCSATRPCSTYV